MLRLSRMAVITGTIPRSPAMRSWIIRIGLSRLRSCLERAAAGRLAAEPLARRAAAARRLLHRLFGSDLVCGCGARLSWRWFSEAYAGTWLSQPERREFSTGS